MESIYKKYEQNKSSGWMKFFIGLGMLVIAVPLMLFGIAQATYNGIAYMTPHRRRIRKVEKLKVKQQKEQVKQELEELKNEKRNTN